MSLFNNEDSLIAQIIGYVQLSGLRRQPNDREAIIDVHDDRQRHSNALRKSWARLIQKIYEVDPLICPKCQGVMRIISFIEDQQIIREILTHLGIWLIRSRPPPKINHVVTLLEPTSSDSYAHTPHPNSDDYADPEYAWNDYIQS